jgi:hypothetical protein
LLVTPLVLQVSEFEFFAMFNHRVRIDLTRWTYLFKITFWSAWIRIDKS